LAGNKELFIVGDVKMNVSELVAFFDRNKIPRDAYSIYAEADWPL
jgi:hypothetical protein